MFKEKAKNFYEKHKTAIIAVGGAIVSVGVIALVASSTKEQDGEKADTQPGNWLIKPDESMLQLAEEYNGEFVDGSSIPAVSKEEATRFLEERGNQYQIDVFDEGKEYESSCVWITKSKTENEIEG